MKMTVSRQVNGKNSHGTTFDMSDPVVAEMVVKAMSGRDPMQGHVSPVGTVVVTFADNEEN